MANPLKGEVIRLYKTVSELVNTRTHVHKASLCPVQQMVLICLSSSKSCCISGVSTPRDQPISESAWSQLSWRIKTWQTLKRLKSWWPGASLSSRNWRLSISSGNIEQWRRGIMSQKNDYTQHQMTLLEWNTGYEENAVVPIFNSYYPAGLMRCSPHYRNGRLNSYPYICRKWFICKKCRKVIIMELYQNVYFI